MIHWCGGLDVIRLDAMESQKGVVGSTASRCWVAVQGCVRAQLSSGAQVTLVDYQVCHYLFVGTV